jgi:sulfite exporter TauE/SafE
VLGASLAGSAHCVSMCGGIVVATARGPRSWVAYHLGRLAGYLVLGAVAGHLGGRLLDASSSQRWVGLLAATFLGAGLIVAGARVWRGRLPHIQVVSSRVLGLLYAKARGNAALSGLLTALLPCGWLHVFVLGAAGTQGARAGAGLLLLFWVGTLPALAAAPWVVKQVLRPAARRAPRLAAVLLILAGVATVGARVTPLIPSSEARATGHHCH